MWRRVRVAVQEQVTRPVVMVDVHPPDGQRRRSPLVERQRRAVPVHLHEGRYGVVLFEIAPPARQASARALIADAAGEGVETTMREIREGRPEVGLAPVE